MSLTECCSSSTPLLDALLQVAEAAEQEEQECFITGVKSAMTQRQCGCCSATGEKIRWYRDVYIAGGYICDPCYRRRMRERRAKSRCERCLRPQPGATHIAPLLTRNEYWCLPCIQRYRRENCMHCGRHAPGTLYQSPLIEVDLWCEFCITDYNNKNKDFI